MHTSLLEAAAMPPLDLILYVGFPYAVIVLFVAMTLKRYITDKYSFSSFSSQFLENRHHFWGSVPWHIGILALVVGHGVAFLIPKGVLLWNAIPIRLWILELSGLIFAIVALTGLFNLIFRRITDAKVRVVTSKMDWVILSLLLVQVLTGIYVALFDRWGSSWFASVISHYLQSLFL
ncbi:MAG: respiratory nitrate reductase subunit gamma, partial [Planctomycetes bacterium]|nr:respiratory nitrate reductase subunit gamma [Planctomycetota bacterium]